MNVRWAGGAETGLEAFLDYLQEVAPHLVREARDECRAAAEQLGRRPLIARPSRWAGLREWSLPRWRKILVFRVDGETIVILAFVDARQDMSKLDPRDD